MNEQDRRFLAASLAEDGMPIAAGRPAFPPRRVVVRLTDREKSDPSALLAAVGSALSDEGISVEWQIVSDNAKRDGNGITGAT
jgi:hypothetical protein